MSSNSLLPLPFRPKYLLQHPALTPSASFPFTFPLLTFAVKMFTAGTSKVTLFEELNFVFQLKKYSLVI
jgi:hypothetical protein